MLSNLKVALVYGGKSSEREISIKSGEAVEKALRRLNVPFRVFDPINVEEFINEILKYQPDVVFNVLHGKNGEDGSIQGLFEVLGLKYTGSPVKASSIAMDKSMAKSIAKCIGVNTPYWITVKSVKEVEDWKNYPAVVKPNSEGSSIGVSIVKDSNQLYDAVAESLKIDEEVVVEEFIQGREITVSILNGEVLEPIEIVVEEGFYDFHNKYLSDKTTYITSPPLEEGVRKKIEEDALTVYKTIGCRGAARVDFILRNNKPYFLEINTIPGMTDHSLLPKAAEACGISFDELVIKIIEGAINEK